MGKLKSYSNINTLDPFTVSEFHNLLRIINIFAAENPQKAEREGNSVLLKSDITIDDFISAQGIFTAPFTMKENSANVRIKKESYCGRKENISARVITETFCQFVLLKEKSRNEQLECELASHTTYTEKIEATLLSKRKTFIEKIHTHTLSIKDRSDAKNPGKIFKQEGFCKIDASTGYIVEEK